MDNNRGDVETSDHQTRVTKSGLSTMSWSIPTDESPVRVGRRPSRLSCHRAVLAHTRGSEDSNGEGGLRAVCPPLSPRLSRGATSLGSPRRMPGRLAPYRLTPATGAVPGSRCPSWVARQGAAALGVRAAQRRREAGAAWVALHLKGTRGGLARVSKTPRHSIETRNRGAGDAASQGRAACGCGDAVLGTGHRQRSRNWRPLVCPSLSGDVWKICSRFVIMRPPGSGGAIDARDGTGKRRSG